jgi:hypothetical protein
MGTDIHAYIDYDEKINNDVVAYPLARIYIDRDYWLFTIMAGIRSASIQEQTPISPPKGLPERMSWRVQNDAYLMVVEDGIDGHHINNGCCTREYAESYGKYTDETKRYVHHPDWHSHTWFTLNEVNQIIRKYSMLKSRKQIWLQDQEPVPSGYKLDEQEWSGLRLAHKEETEPAKIPMEILAIRGLMTETQNSGHNCKLICWFDN